jgi:hypothetical protein
MTEIEPRLILMELDASVARDLVESGYAEYYIAGERGVVSDLVEVAINASGGVVAVVAIELSKKMAKAVMSALKRHGRDSGDVAAVTAGRPGGSSGDRVRAIVTLEDDGTGLYGVICSSLPPSGETT